MLKTSLICFEHALMGTTQFPRILDVLFRARVAAFLFGTAGLSS